jgi:hypothetical protein
VHGAGGGRVDQRENEEQRTITCLRAEGLPLDLMMGVMSFWDPLASKFSDLKCLPVVGELKIV